jgi:hypothetical protein
MIRYIAALILLFSVSAFPPTGHAQPVAAEAAATAEKPSPPPAADPAQVKELVQTLKDPASN